MNRKEAQFILQACRPNGQDAHDPQFTEALKLAQTDPELQRWFAEQNSFDSAVSAGLKRVPVPVDLKDSILANQHVLRPRFGLGRRAILVLAASAALLATLVVFYGKRVQKIDFAAYRQAILAAAASQTEHLQLEPAAEPAIRKYLSAKSAESTFQLPPLLAKGKPMGCSMLKTSGRKVSMLCYFVDGHHFDMFVTRDSELAGGPPQGALEFSKVGWLSTASWRENGLAYVLTSNDDEETFRKRLHARNRLKTPFNMAVLAAHPQPVSTSN